MASLLGVIRESGARTGVVINPGTDERDSELDSLVQQGLVDNILVMTVQPGFGGQSFMTDQLAKVARLRERYPRLDIQVDGGVKLSNVSLCYEAGANVIVSGTGILAQPCLQNAVRQMRA